MLLVKILAESTDLELPITLEEFSSHTINTFSRGYHEYMPVWIPQIGDDSLFCRRKLSNDKDEYAEAIVAIDHFKREIVVGHVVLLLSKTLNKFLCFPGSYASCKVTGTRINRGVGVRLHRINMMIEEIGLNCKK